MALPSLGRWLRGLATPSRPYRKAPPRRPGCRLHLEHLESRNLLSRGPGGPSQLLAPLSGSQGSTPGGPALVTTGTQTLGGDDSSGGPSALGVLSTSGSSGGSSSSSGGTSGGSGSSGSSGPGYPLPPASGPTLQGDLVAPPAPTTTAVPVKQSDVVLDPVVLAGGSVSGSSLMTTTVNSESTSAFVSTPVDLQPSGAVATP
jgi:hypothetical protein